jgi:hypothetical protein
MAKFIKYDMKAREAMLNGVRTLLMRLLLPWVLKEEMSSSKNLGDRRRLPKTALQWPKKSN